MRNINIKKVISMVLVVALAAAVFTGCDGSDEVASAEPGNIAFVFSIANNNTVVDTGIEELSSLPAVPGTAYSFILADGTPSEIYSDTVPDLTEKGYTDVMMARVEASIRAGLEEQIASAAPDSGGVDLGAAITLGVRTLKANAEEGRENILVLYASGISDTGVINNVESPVYSMDVDASVEAVANALNLDLSDLNLHVVLYTIGDVGGEQDALSSDEQTKLRQFYESLFYRMGAEVVTIKEDLPLAESYSFDQPVSCMATEGTVSSLVVNAQDVNGSETTSLLANGGVLSFDETTISFQSGTATLSDRDAALESLAYVVDYLEGSPDSALLIVGTTACWGGEAYCLDLSETRAQAVCSLLEEDGIDGSRLTAVGVGYGYSDFYTYDQTEDGNLDEAIAPLNRSVKIVLLDSEIARDIMQAEWKVK